MQWLSKPGRQCCIATINTIEASNIELLLEITSSNRVGHKWASHIHARVQKSHSV